MFYALENPDEPERTIIQVRQYAMAGRNEDGDGGYGGIFLPREIIIWISITLGCSAVCRISRPSRRRRNQRRVCEKFTTDDSSGVSCVFISLTIAGRFCRLVKSRSIYQWVQNLQPRMPEMKVS